MYDYNNDGMNRQDTQYTQFQGNYPTEPQPPKKPNTHKTGKVVALIAAVAVLCGGMGFGGAFAANKAMEMISGGTTTSSTANTPESTEDNSSLSSDAQEVIDSIQAGVTSHTVSGNVEYNSDGTYAYTRDLVKAVKDSIVYIEVYVTYRGQETLYGAGSGIVISQDGYIITNAHVAENDSYPVSKLEVNVNTTDPETGDVISNKYVAELLGSDTDTDLAVLKIDATDLTAAKLGNSDELSLGDDVVVIGNPLGLETSVSKGVVSGLNRQVYDDNSISAIQTDTAINSGNSGGGMFNMYGEVVGVVNMKLINDNAENLGFAITINDAKAVISDLITKGYVSGRPILGITCIQVSDYLGAIQGMTPGLLVTDIDQTLAIADSELVVGDTITAINGTEVRSVDEVSEVIKDMKPGDTVTVTVVRTDSRGRDKTVKFDIVLSEYSGR
ncbi:MAG: trypsin-like peptidase domain-containing protein [Oscillospiraceae bacterium]|nr:trypsin-like peptidase domain-containing protein [Oscillospiraceae bacterium]